VFLLRLVQLWSKRSGSDPRQKLGRRGEQVAERHLRKRGLRILERNWRCWAGEIDLIARDGEVLVFVEVKTRADLASDPEERVDAAKRAQVKRVAAVYLARFVEEPLVRYDVVAVVLEPGGEPVVRHHVAEFS
jgi:putative endonuclease